MESELILYTHPRSRGRVVRWMLEETGAAYETEVFEYGEAMRSSSYLAINPMGKVPAIVHRGAVVTECAAICAYPADAFAGAGLLQMRQGRGGLICCGVGAGLRPEKITG